MFEPWCEDLMAPLPPFFQGELRRADGGFRRSICRLGLATRGAGHLTPDDVLHAVERGRKLPELVRDRGRPEHCHRRAGGPSGRT